MENQAYISHVHLKGYKSIRDMEIDLLPGLNIIIGPNGSGKTNFVDLLFQCLTKRFLQFTPFKATLKATGMKGKRWDLLNIKEKDLIKIDYSASQSVNEKFNRILDVKTETQINDKEPQFHNYYVSQEGETMVTRVNLSKTEVNIISIFAEFGYPNPIFAITSPSQYSVVIENGEASGLYFENGQSPNDFFFRHLLNNVNYKSENKEKVFSISTQLISYLKSYTPIEDLKINDEILIIKEKNNIKSFNNIQLNFLVKGQWLKWNELSDGTKRIFYIVSLIICENQIQDVVSIFLEEPELGIHPDQLYKLMDFLKEQSKEKQIIITTHSPEVMNILNKDELDRIIVTRYDAEKGTQMHKLSPQQIKKGQAYMKKVGHLSDFWVHSNLEEYEVEEN